MVLRLWWATAVCLALSAKSVVADVTTYGTATTDASGALATPCIGAVACDGRVLSPPGLPAEGINTSIPVQLFSGGMDGLSIGIPGHFAGFSIELSVADKLRTSFVSFALTWLFSMFARGNCTYLGAGSCSWY